MAHVIFKSLESQKSMEEVVTDTENVLRSLGGMVTRHGNNQLVATGASNGVNFAFTADFTTMVDIKQVKEGQYDIQATVNTKPNATFWICFGLGWFFLWFLWIICVFYFFIDPTQIYNAAFQRIG